MSAIGNDDQGQLIQEKLEVDEIDYYLYEEEENTTGCVTLIENRKTLEKTSICNPNASDNLPPQIFKDKLSES